MRSAPVLLAALLASLAGCSSDPGQGPAPAADPQHTALNATLPADIHASETVTGSADPLNYAMMPPCTTPTAKCFEYPFTAEGKVRLNAMLAWSLEANDFDLYIYEGGTLIASSAAGPTKSEAIEDTFPAGAYRIVVAGWDVVQDTFTLDVTFS